MADSTNIEWADSTFNPWIGCTKVSPGCDHCYAEALDRRFAVSGHAMHWGAGKARRRTRESNWRRPLRWNAKHAEFFRLHGRRQRVFCASLADVFDNEVDPAWRDDLFGLIESTPNLDWLLLTKRIGNVANMLPIPFDFERHYPNVWIGATVVNQAEAARDIPKLLGTPAAVRFVSIEPMLGPVRLDLLITPNDRAIVNALNGQSGTGFETNLSLDQRGIDWVICGGESGPNARAMHPDWARSLRDQCAAADVPFLFKQWGEWHPIDQIDEAALGQLYKPRRKARDHEDQDTVNDYYGQRCIVPTGIIHRDGSVHSITDLRAFETGTGAMQVFKRGKQASGRLLDGRTCGGFPA